MTKDLNLLRLLLVLDETRQTQGAAKIMHLSQPTISVMLKKLREQFQDPLFIRDKNYLEPTIKCRQLLLQIPALLDQLDALYVTHNDWDISQLSGEVSLLFPPPLMTVLAAPLIAKLTKQAPNVTINCSHWGRDAVHELEMQRMTWGISYLPMETNKNILQKDIGHDRFTLIMRKGHPLACNDIEEVIQYPLCINNIPGYTEASKTEMLIKKHAFNKTVNVRTSDMGVMLELVNESDMIGVTSQQYVKLLPDSYRFETLPEYLQNDTFRRSFALFTHQRNRHQPLTQWLADEVTRIMQG